MAYVDEGRGSAVVLVHGSPVSSHLFRHAIAELTGRFRVVAPDLLGFGESTAPLDGADFLLQAYALGELLDHLQLGPIRLVAHDWGGPIAMGCMAARPTQLERLVLMNTTILPDFTPPAYWRPLVGPWLGEWLVVRLNAVAWVLPTMMRAWRSKELRRIYLKPLRNIPTRRTVLVLEQQRGYHTLMNRVQQALAQLQVPTLILWGQPDPYFRHDQIEQLAKCFTHTERQIIPGGGHFPSEDAPAEVTSALERFLGRAD